MPIVAPTTVMSQGKESNDTIQSSVTTAIAIAVTTASFNAAQTVDMVALPTTADPTVSVRTKSERTTPTTLVWGAVSAVVTPRHTTVVAPARLLADTVATQMQTAGTASATEDTQQGKNTASARRCINVT
jgi:hypothetical protein